MSYAKLRQTVLFLAVLVSLLVSSSLMHAPQSQAAEIRGEPARYQAQATPQPPAPRQDATPSRVRSSGKLIVGTSADYPPFAYYDKNFKLDGFDVVLSREIAKRMGLSVDIKDYAFDGLLGALQLGQIDAAIGAISPSVEREQLVDFTNVYYVSEDAVVTLPFSPIGEVSSERDLARWRVGAQRGSIYYDWLKKTLVDPGLMPATNLYVYPDIAKAGTDLKAGRIDAIVLDLEPARALVSDGDLKVAGQGLNRQVYAIAVPAGDTWLQDSINVALEQLQDTGFVAQQVEKYMGLGSGETAPVPTATPEPCIDGMGFVADLSYDDTQRVPLVSPGQSIRKGWRLRNTGTCPWTRSFKLVYAGGNVPAAQMGGTVVSVPVDVLPGATVDLYADLVAPTAPGTYRAYWQMVNGAGVAFGERIWVTVAVPAPTPTPAPGPEIQFSVDRTTVQRGECVNFSWNVRYVSAVYFYREGEDWRSNPAVGQETRQACPPSTSAHYLRVVQLDGTVDTRQITIYVNEPIVPPRIARLTATPDGTITLGQCVTIRWEITGAVQEAVLGRSGTVLGTVGPTGSIQDCPPRGTMVYELSASGPGGSDRVQRNVTVVEPSIPTPPATFIEYWVDRTVVNPGDCVTFTWNAPNAKSAYFFRGGEKPREHSVAKRATRSVCPSETKTYYLMVEWPNKKTETREIRITVNNRRPPVPGGLESRQ